MSTKLIAMAPVPAATRSAASRERVSPWRLIAVWRERHAWRYDLRRFDDRMLMDIGMSRADAEAEIAKPLWLQ